MKEISIIILVITVLLQIKIIHGLKETNKICTYLIKNSSYLEKPAY